MVLRGLYSIVGDESVYLNRNIIQRADFRRIFVGIGVLASAEGGGGLVGRAQAGEFVGYITADITQGGSSETVSYAMEAGRVRMDFGPKEAPRLVVLADILRGTADVLVPSKRAYVEYSLTIAGGAKMRPGGIFQLTGRSRTILGFRAVELVETSGKGSNVLWAAGGLGRFVAMPAGARRTPATAWEEALRALGMFPLSAVYSDPTGQERLRFTVTAVNPQPLTPGLFELTAGYVRWEAAHAGPARFGSPP